MLVSCVRNTLAFGLFLFICASCNENKVEPAFEGLPEDAKSLERLLDTNPDDNIKMEIYWRLYKEYRDLNSKLALKNLSLQMRLASNVDNKLYLGKAYFGQGLLYKNNSNYIEAVESYLQAVSAFEAINEKERIATVLTNIGNIFTLSGNYDYAEKFYLKADGIYAEEKDIPRQVLGNFNLALCNSSKKTPDFAAADKYFKEALQLTNALQERKSYFLNRIYNQIGIMNFQMEKYDLAVENYLQSLHYLDGENIEEQKAISYANVGEVYLHQHNYTEANKWLDQSVDLLDYISDGKRVVGIYNILGELLLAQGKYPEATHYLELAIKIADKEVINEPLQQTLELTRTAYKVMNKSGKAVSVERYEQVLDLYGKQDALEDELVEKTNFKALQAALALHVELDNEKKEKKAESEMKLVFVVLALVLGIIALFISYRLRSTGFKLNQAGNKIILAKQILNTD